MKELVVIVVECVERGEWGRKVVFVVCKLLFIVELCIDICIGDLIVVLIWFIDVV